MAGKKKKKKKGADRSDSSGPRFTNRRAWKEYHILEKLECGMALLGSEVKSIRAGNARIDEAYVRIDDGELFLVGANIASYKHSVTAHDPVRKRKLLIHKRQIMKLFSHLQQKGRTMIPLNLYFTRGRAKLEIGIAEGKSKYDKRDALRKKQQQKDMDRAMRR